MASSLLNVSRLVPVIAHAAVYSAISEKPRTALAFIQPHGRSLAFVRPTIAEYRRGFGAG